MFRLSIRTLLVLFLILQVGLVLGLAGFYLQRQLQRQLEAELARRLIASAQTSAHLVNNAVGASAVVSLLPGDEETRTVRSLERWLGPLLQSNGLSRLVIFDRERRAYFDSAKELGLGKEYIRLRFDENEINSVWRGAARDAKLFFDMRGEPFKAAYAPLYENEQVIAVLGVEGSAASLAVVEETRNVLWTIALLGLLGAAASGLLFARRITGPLESLRQAATAIASGAEKVNFNLKGTEEITFLATTMAAMREAVVRREQSLRLMLAGVAHEIRNPLGGIELHAGLLEKDVPVELRPRVKKIRAEVQRLEKIVRDFLEYARPQTSREQAVALQPLLEDLRETVQPQFPRILWRLEADEQTVARTDPEQLRRMLLNLLRNAIEAMNETGEIKLTVRAREEKIELHVRDNGPGVPAELREKIFEPFFTTRAQGSGLGLALVRQLAEQNGGTIRLLDSNAGGHFLLTLPKA